MQILVSLEVAPLFILHALLILTVEGYSTKKIVIKSSKMKKKKITKNV